MHQHPLARFQMGIVEQHVLDGAVGDRDAGCVPHRDAVGDLEQQPGGMVGQILREPIDVETANAGDILTQIVASSDAGGARAARQGGVGDYTVAGFDAGHAGADGHNLAGGLGADSQRDRGAWRTPCRENPTRRCGSTRRRAREAALHRVRVPVARRDRPARPDGRRVAGALGS